jgi:hypothetical protein
MSPLNTMVSEAKRVTSEGDHLRFAICDLRSNSIANRKLQIANDRRDLLTLAANEQRAKVDSSMAEFARKERVMSLSRKFKALLVAAWWLPVGAIAISYVGGCEHEHHDRDEHVAIVDEHGFRHEGSYDAEHHWHGGYEDEHHVHHDDPNDWHR